VHCYTVTKTAKGEEKFNFKRVEKIKWKTRGKYPNEYEIKVQMKKRHPKIQRFVVGAIDRVSKRQYIEYVYHPDMIKQTVANAKKKAVQG
jgi:hypothetical protein